MSTRTPEDRGPWKVHGSETRYASEHLRLQVDRVTRPDGEPGEFASVTLPLGVLVLAIDEHDRVLLVQQFRYAQNGDTIEAVAGAVEEESPLEAARRELKEELGAEADRIEPMGRIDQATSVLDGGMELFVARGLRFGDTEREGTEQMRTLRVPFADAVEMAMDGRIRHAPTALLILRVARQAGR